MKAAVVGPNRDGNCVPCDPSSEASLLCALAKTEHYRAFSPESLQLRLRARAEWRRKDVEFYACVRQLIAADVSPLGSELLAGIADVIRPSELIRLSAGDNRLVFIFTERNPSLACASELWVGTPDYQHELFDHMKHAPITPEMTRAMLIAMFEAHADSVAFDTYHHCGSLVVHVFLDWCNDHPHVIGEMTHRRWIEVLGETPQETLEWLKGNLQPKPQTVALIVSQLDPRSSVVQGYGTGVWQRVLDVVERDRDADSRVRRILAEFLLPYSLAILQRGSARLAEFSFPIIHEALATNSLSYEAWRRLDPILPRLSWPHSWDKCERLRRGMKEAGFAVTMREE